MLVDLTNILINSLEEKKDNEGDCWEFLPNLFSKIRNEETVHIEGIHSLSKFLIGKKIKKKKRGGRGRGWDSD